MVIAQRDAKNKAIEAIKKGEVFICPTDTVYGFLADATNKKAVNKIFKIKKRAKSKPLPLFVSSIKVAKEIAEISKKQEKILKKYWPGKYTFVLERKPKVKLYGVDSKTIALRLPRNNFLQGLLKEISVPLVQTSVNISGKDPFYKIEDIKKEFGGSNLLLIDAGDIKKSKSSKILDITEEKIKVLRK